MYIVFIWDSLFLLNPWENGHWIPAKKVWLLSFSYFCIFVFSISVACVRIRSASPCVKVGPFCCSPKPALSHHQKTCPSRLCINHSVCGGFFKALFLLLFIYNSYHLGGKWLNQNKRAATQRKRSSIKGSLGTRAFKLLSFL